MTKFDDQEKKYCLKLKHLVKIKEVPESFVLLSEERLISLVKNTVWSLTSNK